MTEFLTPIMDTVGTMFKSMDEIGVQYGVANTTAVSAVVDQLHAAAGFPDDQLRFVISLLAAYPLGLIHRLIPGELPRHLYSALTGLLLVQFCFPAQWFGFLFFAVAFYLLLLLIPSHPWVYFCIVMGVNATTQIYRMYIDYMGWSLDFTGCQMVMTQKVTAMAWQVYDNKYNPKATDSQKRRSVEIPGPLQYLGFVLFPAGVMAGPAFNIHEYLTFTDTTAYDMTADVDKGEKRKPSPMPAGSVQHSLRCLATGFLCIGFNVVGGSMLNIPGGKISSDEFAKLPFFKRVALNWADKVVFRSKYYFAWCVAEGGCVMSGLGFNSYEGTKSRATGKPVCLGHDRSESSPDQPAWNRLTNSFPIKMEMSQSISEVARYWNPLTSRWLKQTIFERTGKNTTAVYFVSAFWHGFYPGYYLFFLTAALGQNVAAIIRKTIRPHFLKDDGKTPTESKKFYDLVSLLVTTLTVNYWVVAFVEMDFALSLKAYQNLFCYGHVAILLVLVLCQFVPRKKAPKKD